MVSIPVSYASPDSAKFSQLYRAGEYSQALKYALILSKKSPRNMKLRYYYADCLFKVGKLAQAQNEYKVIAKYSSDPELVSLANQSLSKMSQREGSNRKAVEEEDKVLRAFDSKVDSIQNSDLSQAQKDRKLEEAYKEMQRKKSVITNRYRVRRSTAASADPSNSSLRLVPAISGSNVKNYENLGDSSDVKFIPDKPPLKAKAKKLKLKPKKEKSDGK